MIPFCLAALFGFSLASVEVRNGVIRYRRLLKWRLIKQEEINGVNVIWPPVLASLKLGRFVFPWGNLYFVLDGDPDPFHGGGYQIPDVLRKTTPPPDANMESRYSLKLFIAAAGGILAFGCCRLIQSYLVASPSGLSSGTPGSGAYNWVTALYGRFEFQLIFIICFIFLAIYRRREPNAWIFSFLAGLGLPYIAFHFLK